MEENGLDFMVIREFVFWCMNFFTKIAQGPSINRSTSRGQNGWIVEYYWDCVKRHLNMQKETK